MDWCLHLKMSLHNHHVFGYNYNIELLQILEMFHIFHEMSILDKTYCNEHLQIYIILDDYIHNAFQNYK